MATLSWGGGRIDIPTPWGTFRVVGKWVRIPMGLITTIIAGGVAGLTTAGLSLLWKSLPAFRREELLSGGTEAVLAVFNNRTANREG